jgi:DNA-directed RNA polymerase subunit H (RpoH/RPB5)
MAKEIKVQEHVLVPKHLKLSLEETKDLLEMYNLSTKQLPKIHKTDPAIQHLNPELGEIIKIVRDSATAGKSEFFRVVVE